MTEDHNIWEVTDRLFVVIAHSCHCDKRPQHFGKSQIGYLWQELAQFIVTENTTFEMSQIGYMWQEPAQFILTEDHNICEDTDRLFVARACSVHCERRPKHLGSRR